MKKQSERGSIRCILRSRPWAAADNIYMIMILVLTERSKNVTVKRLQIF
jgi:hypothetical protein